MKTIAFTGSLVVTSLAMAGDQLFDQIGGADGEDLDGGSSACQYFEPGFAAYDVAALDDFTIDSDHKITSVEAVITGFNGYAALAGITGYQVNIYSSPETAALDLVGDIASADFAAPDSTTNIAALLDIVQFDVNIELAAGTYYIAVIPTNEFGVNGQTAVATSNLGDFGSWQANPNGGFGFPDDLEQNATNSAYRLKGIAGVDSLLGITWVMTDVGQPEGLSVFQIFAVFDDPEARMLGVVGDADNLLHILTDAPEGYHQTPPAMLGSDLAPSADLVAIFPELAWDSFVTIGLSAGYKGVDETGLTASWSDDVSPGFNEAGTIGPTLSEGWFNGNPDNVQGAPDADGRVLIAQLVIEDTGDDILGVSAPIAHENSDGVFVTTASFVINPSAEAGFADPDEVIAFAEPIRAAAGNLGGDAGLAGDSFTDVVVIIPDQDPGMRGNVQVFLNRGNDIDGEWLSFMPNAQVMIGREPSGVVTGSFNDDPSLDVVVCNAGDNNLTLLFNDNKGNGTFFPGVDLDIFPATRPSAVAALDFDGDDDMDLAVANQGFNDVRIFENVDGNGTFVFLSAHSTGGMQAAVATLTASELDPEKIKCPDMAGVNQAGPGGGVGSVFVLLNNNGVFPPEADIYQVGHNPRDLSIGDVDGDGLPDIVVVNAADKTISILINQGKGTFAQPLPAIDVGFNPRAIEAVDLDGDLDLDLAVVTDETMHVLYNVGKGVGEVAFGPPIHWPVDANPNFVITADVNADARADLLTVNDDDEGGTGGSISTLLNELPEIACPWDLDGDGTVGTADLMILLESWGDPYDTTDLIELLRNWGPCPK